MKRISMIMVLLVLSAVFVFSETVSADRLRAAGLQPITPQTVLPAFSLPTLANSSKKEGVESYSGKVVLLNFWASWCGPCKAEMPSMEKLYKELKSSGFVVLAVDLQESKATVQSFITKNGFTFPILLDETGTVGNKYGIRSIPTSFLIGKDGKAVAGVVGSIDWEKPAIKEIIRDLLK